MAGWFNRHEIGMALPNSYNEHHDKLKWSS